MEEEKEKEESCEVVIQDFMLREAVSWEQGGGEAVIVWSSEWEKHGVW